MARSVKKVKDYAGRFVRWADRYPRTGWYIAIWATLVTLNTFIGLFDVLLRVVS